MQGFLKNILSEDAGIWLLTKPNSCFRVPSLSPLLSPLIRFEGYALLQMQFVCQVVCVEIVVFVWSKKSMESFWDHDMIFEQFLLLSC